MTKDASFKKVVRRHAEETGQRYTEALTDLQGLGARMSHEPVAEPAAYFSLDRERFCHIFLRDKLRLDQQIA